MLIIQCDPAQLPGLYSDLLDRKMQPVGTIVDLFGNVKTPYAAVFCKGQCMIRPDEKLYAKGPAQPGRDRSVYRKKA
jgi:RNA-binding protein